MLFFLLFYFQIFFVILKHFCEFSGNDAILTALEKKKKSKLNLFLNFFINYILFIIFAASAANSTVITGKLKKKNSKLPILIILKIFFL